MSTDRRAVLTTGDVSGLRGGEYRLENTAPDGNEAFEGRASENPLSVASSLR